MTEEEYNKVTIGQLLYRFPNGVSDSPLSPGQYYVITEKYDNGDMELMMLCEYLGDTWSKCQKRRVPKEELLSRKFTYTYEGVETESQIDIYLIADTTPWTVQRFRDMWDPVLKKPMDRETQNED